MAMVCLVTTSCRRAQVMKSKEEKVQTHVPKARMGKKVPPKKIEELEVKEKLDPKYFDAYQPYTEEYRVSVGDVLQVSVFGNEDTLIKEAVVAPDGYLYYLFLDGVAAAGRTLSEVAKDIEIAVAHLFINPEVSILPVQIASQTYMVIGKVLKPGIYPLRSAATLRQALGDAGGIAVGGFKGTTISVASLRDSFIVRNGRKLDIDFEKLIFSEGSDQNIYLKPRDYIYIASSLSKEVFLLGAVSEQKPVPYKDGLTLLGVLSGSSGITGGTTPEADVNRVLVIRGSLETPQVIVANILDIYRGKAKDVYLLPGDIVYAQNKQLRFGKELVRSAIDSFVRAFGSSAGSYVANKHWFPEDE